MKRTMSLLLAVLLCLSMLACMVFPVSAETANTLLAGVTVYGQNVGDYHATYYKAPMMVDGVKSNSSFWNSANGVSSAYLTFDLGQEVSISEIKVYARTATATILKRNIKDYDIFISPVAPTYTATDGTAPGNLPASPVATGTMAESTTALPYGTIGVSASNCGRYVTIYIKNIYSGEVTPSINIQEVEFYGHVSSKIEKLSGISVLGQNVADYSAAYPASALLDGVTDNYNTCFWGTKAGTTEAYVTFDLGTDAALGQMLVYARKHNNMLNRFIKDYEVFASNTAPTYGATGAVPTGLPETPVISGSLSACDVYHPYDIIALSNDTEGRYVTLHVKNLQGGPQLDLAEIVFYAGEVVQIPSDHISVVGQNVQNYSNAYNTFTTSMMLDGVYTNYNNYFWEAKSATSAYVTFDLGSSRSISKLVVYARQHASFYNRCMNEYEIFVGDTAPVYSETYGVAPAGLGETPAAVGSLSTISASAPFGTIKLTSATGRYVTLHILNTQGGSTIDIAEIMFYMNATTAERVALSVSKLDVDYKNGTLILPEIEGCMVKIESSSNTDVVALDGSVNTLLGGLSEIVLNITDAYGNESSTYPISVQVLNFRQNTATSGRVASASASSVDGAHVAGLLINENINGGRHNKYYSTAYQVNVTEIILKMEAESNVSGIILYPRQNAITNFPAGIKVYTSADGTAWSADPVMEITDYQSNNSQDAQPFYFPVQENVQYLKVVLQRDLTVNYIQMAEIEVLTAPDLQTTSDIIGSLDVAQKNTEVKINGTNAQFAAEIIESNNTSIVALDGSITVPDVATDVTLTVKLTNLLDTTDTATVNRVLSVKTQAILDVEAVAAETDLIPVPEVNSDHITMPDVPDGYTITIAESDTPAVVDTTGAITRSADTTYRVRLTFRITNTATGAAANTKALLVPIYKTYVAPSMTQAEIKQIHEDYETKKYGAFVHYITSSDSIGHGTCYADGNMLRQIDEAANAFDVEQFAKDMHDFGVEYVVLTVWHHEGETLFPSVTNQRWRDERRAQDSTEKKTYADRDVIMELLDELDKYGIDLHLYTHGSAGTDYNPEDIVSVGWNDTADNYAVYNQYLNEMYYELCERYGTRLKGLWVDGVFVHIPAGDSQERLRNTCLSFNPAMILTMNAGFHEGEVGLYPQYNLPDYRCWEINRWVDYTNDLQFSRHQVATCLAQQYWWTTVAQSHSFTIQPSSEMFRYLVALSSVTREGGLLASTGVYPVREGEDLNGDIWLHGMRDMLVEVNSYLDPVAESVKNTSVGVAYPTEELLTVSDLEWGVSTESRDGNNIYLHVLNAPDGRTLTLPAPADGSLLGESAVIMNLDGTTTAVTVTNTGSGYSITLPEGKSWDAVDTVIKTERTGYDSSIAEYTGDKVFYDPIVAGMGDGTQVIREIDGVEYYLTVGTNIAGTLTDDCYPVVDGAKQVDFLAGEYQNMYIYNGSYTFRGAKAGIDPNDPDDITAPNVLRASDEGETIIAGGTSVISTQDGKVTMDGFTFKGDAKIQIGNRTTEESVIEKVRFDLINCRNSTAEDAYDTAPATALIHSSSAEHKIVNIRNNRFDGVCFNGTSATSLFVIRNWEGVTENNFISMKDSVTIGNGTAASEIFYLFGESYGYRDWSGKEDVVIRNNHLEGRIATTITPGWYDEYKVHILNNTIVPTLAGYSLMNINVAGSSTYNGAKQYYSHIDTADIRIAGNKVINPDNISLGFVNIGGTVTAGQTEQIAQVSGYTAGSIKIIQNDIDFGTTSGNAFGGSAIAGYDNLVMDITCNKYGSTVTPVKEAVSAHFTALNAEQDHKSVHLVVDTAATETQTGVGHRECSFCGETVESDIVLPVIHAALFTLSLDNGTMEKMLDNASKYKVLWQIGQGQNDNALWDEDPDIHVLEYGVHYSPSFDTLTTYLQDVDRAADLSGYSKSVASFVYAASETALMRVYSNYSFLIRNISQNKSRYGVAYIKYEYDGEIYEDRSEIVGFTTIMDGYIGGIGPTLKDGDGLDD